MKSALSIEEMLGMPFIHIHIYSLAGQRMAPVRLSRQMGSMRLCPRTSHDLQLRLAFLQLTDDFVQATNANRFQSGRLVRPLLHQRVGCWQMKRKLFLFSLGILLFSWYFTVYYHFFLLPAIAAMTTAVDVHVVPCLDNNVTNCCSHRWCFQQYCINRRKILTIKKPGH